MTQNPFPFNKIRKMIVILPPLCLNFKIKDSEVHLSNVQKETLSSLNFDRSQDIAARCALCFSSPCGFHSIRPPQNSKLSSMNVLQPKKTCNFFGLVLHTAMPLPITVCCSDVARGVVPVGAGGTPRFWQIS